MANYIKIQTSNKLKLHRYV